MAITRAQQAKQMLREGGRIGFFRGMREQEQREKAASNRERGREKSERENRAPTMSPGRSMAQFGHAGHAGKSENTAKRHQREGRDVPSNAPASAQNPYSGHSPNEIPEADTNKDGKIGPVESLNQKIISTTTPRKKNQLRRLIDYIGKGRKFNPGIFGLYNSITGKYDLDESDYLGLENVSPMQLQAMFGSGIVGTEDEEKIRDISRVLGQDNITQKEFEQFYPNMNPPPDRDGPDNTVAQDPCKGPNPPAYCFVNQDQDQDDTEDDDDPRNLGGMMTRALGSDFDFSLLADGGRVAAMGGGIMNNDVIGGFADGSMDQMGRQMYGLGKLVKKVTKTIGKIAKSPVGKAAIIGGLGIFGGGGLGVLKKEGLGALVSNFFDKSNPLLFTKGNLSLGKLAAVSSLAPFLFQQEEEEEQDPYRGPSIDIPRIRNNPYTYMAPRFEGSQFAADGGRIGYQDGSKEPVAKKTMPLIDMDGMEKDYRETGGFVEMGRMERADDVPARLSKNEFVFTADAVRNAGDGNIDKGAEVMYNMMKNLESGGEVSEESQGLEGARKMFQTSQRLGEVI